MEFSVNGLGLGRWSGVRAVGDAQDSGKVLVQRTNSPIAFLRPAIRRSHFELLLPIQQLSCPTHQWRRRACPSLLSQPVLSIANARSGLAPALRSSDSSLQQTRSLFQTASTSPPKKR